MPGGDVALPLHGREIAPRALRSDKGSCRQRAKWQGGGAHQERKLFLTKRFFVRQTNCHWRRLVNPKAMPVKPEHVIPAIERGLQVPKVLASQRRALKIAQEAGLKGGADARTKV
jgi:hypothetical protein